MNTNTVIEALVHNWGKITINSYSNAGLSFTLYDDVGGDDCFLCEHEGINLGYCVEAVVDQIEKRFYPQQDRMDKLSAAKKGLPEKIQDRAIAKREK